MKVLFLYKYEYLEPIGIMALSAVLKQHGHRVEFVDLDLEIAGSEGLAKHRLTIGLLLLGKHGWTLPRVVDSAD